MKKSYFKVGTLLVAGCILMSSCIGSFGLFNKVLDWNKTATNNKFLNELIFLVISPVYSICGLADVVVLNTIEFWSGSNPLASNVGKTTQVLGSDGRYYAVKTLKNGYEVTKPDGAVVNFVYDQRNNSWSEVSDESVREIFRFNADGTLSVNMPSGEPMQVELSYAGAQQVQAALTGNFWAAK